MSVFLLLVAITTGGGFYGRALPMPDMTTCLQSVSAARIDGADGGDSEVGIVVTCATSLDGSWFANNLGGWTKSELLVQE